MKGKRIVCLCAALAVLAILWCWRYTTLNAAFSEPAQTNRKIFSMGEVVPYGKNITMESGDIVDGYSLRVDGFAIRDYNDVVSGLPEAENLPDRPSDRLAMVSITLFNDGSSAQGVLLSDLIICGVDNYEKLDRELLTPLNPIMAGNLGISLSSGTEYQIILPFLLMEHNWSDSTWSHLEDYPLFLRMTCVPVTQDIALLCT